MADPRRGCPRIKPGAGGSLRVAAKHAWAGSMGQDNCSLLSTWHHAEGDLPGAIAERCIVEERRGDALVDIAIGHGEHVVDVERFLQQAVDVAPA